MLPRASRPLTIFSEFVDIGAGDEGASAADDDDGEDGGVGGGRGDGGSEPSGTPGLSAFTGGLSMVMTDTESWRCDETSSGMAGRQSTDRKVRLSNGRAGTR